MTRTHPAWRVIARRVPITHTWYQTSDEGTSDEGRPKATCMYLSRSWVYALETDSLHPDYINGGVFNGILVDHQHITLRVLSMGGSFHVPASTSSGPASEWRPTRDSIDLVAPLTMLPTALAVGGWVLSAGMEAYTECAVSCFNGSEASEVVYTAGADRARREVRRVLTEAARVARTADTRAFYPTA
jgi:hypothetical protein